MDSDNEKDNNWGNKKSEYYERNKNADDSDNNEEEAIKIQQTKLKKYKELNLLDSDNEDQEDNKNEEGIKNSNLDKFNLDSSDSSEDEIETKTKSKKTKTKKVNPVKKITTTLTKEDEEEQMQILKNIKINIDEISENITPILEILITEEKDSKLKLNQTKEYLKSKKNVHLLYVIYMLYYTYYKNQNKISDHHPVVKKMFYLRNIMQKVKDADENVFGQIDKILKLIEANKILNGENEEEEGEEGEEGSQEDELIEEAANENKNEFLNKKRTQEFIQENTDRMKKLINEKTNKKIKDKENLIKEIDNKNQMGQRLANEGVLKSRGLFRKRKKYQGNAKLHLREKYHKKEKLRKNFIKEYAGKPEVYGGEVTGIRRDLIRSTKFK